MNDIIDSVDKIYYEDVGRLQLNLSLEEQTELLTAYKEGKTALHKLILSEKKCREKFVELCGSLILEGKSLAKVSFSFNSKKRGHNVRLSERIEKALENPTRKALSELNLSDSVYKSLMEVAPSRVKELCDEVLEGTAKIEDRLVRSALMAARGIAERYSSNTFGIEKMDVIQEANIALLEAVSRYDLDYRHNGQPIKWITFAVHQAEGRVKEWIMENSRLVRLPRSKLDLIFVVLEAINTAKDESINSITDRTNQLQLERGKDLLSYDDVSATIRLLNGNTIDLDGRPLSDDSHGSGSMSDLLPDTSPSVEEKLEDQSNRTVMIDNMKKVLTDPEFTIIYMRYLEPGLDKRKTLEECKVKYAEVKGTSLTRERIRQLEQRAIQKLKDNKSEFADILGKEL